jgi:hypothetical protein
MSKTATRIKIKDAEPILSEDIYVTIKDDNLKEDRLESTLFLYGYPTKSILDILKGLYHENMIKLKAKKMERNPIHKYMCGFLELNDGTIISTISEDPSETKNYWEKFSELKQMLEHLGATVVFDDYEVNDGIKGEIKLGNEYRTNRKKTIPKKYVTELIKNKLICGNEGQIDYHEGLRLDGKTVLLINSSVYLKLRKTGNSFRPFKKYWKKAVACNNGSTCVESKLFYYMYYIHKGLHKHKNDIKGFVSYWIGDDFPPGKNKETKVPNHIISSFCYKKDIEQEKKNFDKVIEVAKQTDPHILILNKERLPTPSALRETGTSLNNTQSMLESRTQSASSAKNRRTSKKNRKADYYYNLNHMSEEILSHVLQPLSIPCPGCILNYNSYKTGRIINWEVLECKIPRNGLQYESIVDQGKLLIQDLQQITNNENIEIGNKIKKMSPDDKDNLIKSIKNIESYFPEDTYPQNPYGRTISNSYLYTGKGKKTKKKHFLGKSVSQKTKKNKKGKKKNKRSRKK